MKLLYVDIVIRNVSLVILLEISNLHLVPLPRHGVGQEKIVHKKTFLWRTIQIS